MDKRPTTAANRQHFTNLREPGRRDGGELAYQRLNTLLEINEKTARDKRLYKSEQEKLEAELMRHPLDTGKTFSYFGLMLGTFPPAAIFIKFLTESPEFRIENLWVLGVIFIINIITATVGFFSGKLIGKMVRDVETYSWWLMLLLLPLIGMFWGVLAGGAGGVIVFLFGALFGGMFGAMVGGAALPVFAILHRLLKKGEAIEFKHFMPLAFGVTFTICAFILGI
jgi:hypothetical protein